jgi:hypothetical protein
MTLIQKIKILPRPSQANICNRPDAFPLSDGPGGESREISNKIMCPFLLLELQHRVRRDNLPLQDELRTESTRTTGELRNAKLLLK